MEAEITRDIIRLIRDKEGVKQVERAHELASFQQGDIVRVTLHDGRTLRMNLSWVHDEEESWIFDQGFPPIPRDNQRAAERKLAPAGR